LSSLFSFFFFVYDSGDPRDLPSFPTRRSSDLVFHERGGRAIDVAALAADLPGQVAMLVPAAMHQLHKADASLDHAPRQQAVPRRSEEHTSELQSPDHLVCRLLLEKKKKKKHDC